MKKYQVVSFLIFIGVLLSSCNFNSTNDKNNKKESIEQKTIIPIYAEPFYNSNPFKINVGKYSEELKHNNVQNILTVSEKIKKNINNVNIETLFVLSTRLYDLGAKNEATYWYYLACLKREVFVRLISNQNIELNQLLFGYKRTLGEFINRDAFSDIDNAISICRKTIKDNQSMKSLSIAYPNIDFDDSKLSLAIDDSSKGLEEMLRGMENNKEEFRKKRKKNGLRNKSEQNTSSQSVKNFLNTKQTIVFDSQNYNLVWSTHPSSNYYKQEYLQSDEKLESFKSMITIDFLKGDFNIEDLVNAKLKELKQIEKNNGIVTYGTLKNEHETMLEFILGTYNEDGKTVKVIERNIYRYVQSNDAQGVLLFAISKRAYGENGIPFLKKVRKDKISLPNKFGKIEIPKIKI